MSPRVSSETIARAGAALNQCSHADERYIFEFAALLAGLKKVVRVQAENDLEYAALSHFANLTGLCIAHSPTRMKVAWTNALGDTFLTSVPWDDPDGTSYAAYLALRQEDAGQAALVESEGTAEEIGSLLGYPKCCCVAYERLENREFWAPVLSEHSPAGHYPPWANRFAYLLYGASLFPDYFPCSLGCEGTQKLAQQVYHLALATDLRALAQQYLALMRRPLIIGSGFIMGVPINADAAHERNAVPALHEWIPGSSQGLPSLEYVAGAVHALQETLPLSSGATARIIYFDR